MQNIVEPRDIVKQLSKNGLKIGAKNLLIYHIKNFNYNTFIYGYSDPFYFDKTRYLYDREANSDEIINLYKFDRDMANHILRFILVIEKIINTSVAYEVINHFNIRDKCLMKIDRKFMQNEILPNLHDVEPKISFIKFLMKLIKYLSSSQVIKIYEDKKFYDDEFMRWRNCPLDIMCLTWSFATSFSFFIALPNTVRQRIMNTFGLPFNYLDGFIIFLKNTLHLRNVISHNNVIYNINIPYQCSSLVLLYEFVFKKSVQSIKLIHMMKLIEFFAHSTTLVSNTHYYFNKLKIQEKFKGKIDLFDEWQK
ncbi:MAG: Abi family protein [Mycoplasmataceae bacterium]|nr:Abi family protein [Mycoplasmataceae bacterium]